MARRAAKKDDMHYPFTDIIETLKNTYKMPIDSFDMHTIHIPSVGDMCIMFGGMNFHYEIKNDDKGKLSKGEREWQERIKDIGHCKVVWDFPQVIWDIKMTKGLTTKNHEYLDIISTLYKDEILPNWKNYKIRFPEEFVKRMGI